MSQEWLRTAGEHAERAADRTDDETTHERLQGLADQLENLADRPRGPDHGRLDRLLNALGEVEETVDAEAASAIEEARGDITRYRETVEGV